MHMEQAEELMARLAAIRERMTRACERKYPLPKVLAVTKPTPRRKFFPCGMPVYGRLARTGCRKFEKNSLF